MPSSGRSNAVTLDFNNNYKALKRMRGFIDEVKFQRAVDRASRFIESNNNNNIRNGESMTPATPEANNILCVASTSIGQI